MSVFAGYFGGSKVGLTRDCICMYRVLELCGKMRIFVGLTYNLLHHRLHTVCKKGKGVK